MTLNDDSVAQLDTLRDSWILHDRALHSARPGQFRNRLDKISLALKAARKSLDLNGENAPELDRHLLIWAMDAEDSEFYKQIQTLFGYIEALEETLSRLKAALPEDPGRKRPYQEQRLILQLAKIYEAAGGTAVAYNFDNGVADTPFRRFAHEFYRALPLLRRRTLTGFDTALVEAL